MRISLVIITEKRMLSNKEVILCAITIFALTTNVSSWVVDDAGCITPDGGIGICVLAKLCGPIRTFLRSVPKPFSRHVQNTFHSYLCGSAYGKPKVCCPSKPIIMPAQMNAMTEKPNVMMKKPNAMTEKPNVMMRRPNAITEKTNVMTRKPNTMTEKPNHPTKGVDIDEERVITSHKNFNLLPQECGFVGSVNKISLGKNASLGEFPWMALLSYKIGNKTAFRCGGTIIHDRYILTAAHCVEGQPLMRVRVGEYDTSKKVDCQLQEDKTQKCSPPVQDLRIEERIIHPRYHMDYTNEDGVNDIALLRVSPMKMSGFVKPICLPNGEIPKQTPKRLIISGWGFTEKASRNFPILQKASLLTLQRNKCQEFYQRQRIKISKTQLCLNAGNSESCMGDSGGPVLTENYIYDDVRSIQYGIISSGGANCGSGIYPGIHTRVVSYMNWILDTIRS